MLLGKRILYIYYRIVVFSESLHNIYIYERIYVSSRDVKRGAAKIPVVCGDTSIT